MVKDRAFTLVELLIVIIIVGVLSGLSIINYAKTKEKVYDKEAFANLKTIQAAESGYKLDMETYYPSTGSVSTIADINNNLGIFLVSGSGRAWNYTVYSTGCAQASRIGYDNRIWYLKVNDTEREPLSGNGCP